MRKVTPSMLGSIALLFHWAPQISRYPKEFLDGSLCHGKGKKDLSVCLQLIYVLYTQSILTSFTAGRVRLDWILTSLGGASIDFTFVSAE